MSDIVKMKSAAEVRADRYQNRVSERVCVWCRKPIEEDNKGVLCRDCAEKNRNRSKANRDWLLQHGICPICRKNPIYPPEKSCLNCKEKSNNSKSDETRAKRRDQYARKIQRRRDAGLCTGCGKRIPEGKYKRCAECRRRQRVLRKRRNQGKWTTADERMWNGICKCGSADMQPGTKVCKSCYAKYCASLEKARAAAKAIRDAERDEEYRTGKRKGRPLENPPITYKKRSLIQPDLTHQRKPKK